MFQSPSLLVLPFSLVKIPSNHYRYLWFHWHLRTCFCIKLITIDIPWYPTLHIGCMIGILSLYHYRILGLPLLNPSPPSNLKGSSQVVRWPERLADGRLLSDVAEEANAQAWAIQKRGNHGDFMGFSDGIHGNSKIVNLRWRIERWQWRIWPTKKVEQHQFYGDTVKDLRRNMRVS